MPSSNSAHCGLRQASKCLTQQSIAARNLQRCFSTSRSPQVDLEATSASSPDLPPPSAPQWSKKLVDPNYVYSPRSERRLMRAGIRPIGSRRRRAVLSSLGKTAVPFEQLPYQCFQEARKVLAADRAEKLEKIDEQRRRIRLVEAKQPTEAHAVKRKEETLQSMHQQLHKLKIFADINDPVVKKRFEDGQGDMNKPIYRHLAEKKWEQRRKLIADQRKDQFNLTPDLLMTMKITTDLSFKFTNEWAEPGAYINSDITLSHPPQLKAQVFDKGERLVSIAIIDSDVPNVEKDELNFRCHYLAVNVPLSPTTPDIDLRGLDAESQVVSPWLAPWAQKGSPYHRLSIWILEQQSGQKLDLQAVTQRYGPEMRSSFNLRSFVDVTKTKATGVSLFRTQWDETMDAVMRKMGIADADMELKRKRNEPLPYKWKPSMSGRYR